MKRNRFSVLSAALLLASMLLLGGCYYQMPPQQQTEVSEDVKDETGSDLLNEINDQNTFDELISRYGQIKYELKGIREDGSEDIYSVYKDEAIYVQDNKYKTIIVDGDDVYGYDKDNGAPYRYIFPGTYDSFMDSIEYASFYADSESEEIIKREDTDGRIYLETTLAVDSSDLYTAFGYKADDADSIFTEYVIDAATLDILESKAYLEKGGEKTLYFETILDRECEKYVPDQTIIDGVFGDDVRTLKLIADAGTDHEQEYTQTVTKGSLFHVEFGDEFITALFSDSECVTPVGKVDRNADITVYLKRRVDYSDENNWAYYAEGEDKQADLFLICPTVDVNDEFYMSMEDEETKEHFLGALNMERGIYEENARMFAPYYRQGAMKIYSMTPDEREPYLEYAYDDIAEAFEYYLINENDGRPIILAGFSQGADMCYRLLMDYFADEELKEQLVAVYAIGWPCSEEMIEQFPQIRPAEAEDDYGVVVSFDCEAPDVTDTFTAPADVKACQINPLNWKTDETPADASENLGACFPDYSANITKEVPQFCGCYIDTERSTVKVPDLDPAEYPAIVPGLPEGAYHIYDYQFFYRNLQDNVGKRLESYLNR
ncbi:MAG: DUF3089 domain-containing protein [Lachnospiraceae bacterium]|nr:DUF3089 domain-containing protein [Lachnospiraceae bacterium]